MDVKVLSIFFNLNQLQTTMGRFKITIHTSVYILSFLENYFKTIHSIYFAEACSELLRGLLCLDNKFQVNSSKKRHEFVISIIE